jgi:ABC-type transporter MlaC component
VAVLYLGKDSENLNKAFKSIREQQQRQRINMEKKQEIVEFNMDEEVDIEDEVLQNFAGLSY